jgi:catechol 2,3-dioxygenase-like lactoylglutathione lyase family enzyme
MLPIKGLYEVAIKVRDLAVAEPFYRDLLGLTEGLRDDVRKWLFLRAGGGAGMFVLQEEIGEWPKQHFAFTVQDEDLEPAKALLEAHGVTTEGPVFHKWMPARSLYFSDPDGNDLELCAPL